MRKPEPSLSCLIHATCVDLAGRGVLILGPPGSGKSDMALRLVDQSGCGLGGIPVPAVLVADDQVMLNREAGQLIARPPQNLQGLIEIRGLGVLKILFRRQTVLTLIVTLTPSSQFERMPEPDDMVQEILGIRLTMVRLDPKLASAPARVRAALDSLSVAEPSMISTSPH